MAARLDDREVPSQLPVTTQLAAFLCCVLFCAKKNMTMTIPHKLNMQQFFITLNLNNIPLSPYNSVKYLGIYIDQQLN